MKHYLEVDIGLSVFDKKCDLEWPWSGHFRAIKVKIERSVLTIAPRPMVHVHSCTLRKSASWPVISTDFYRGQLKVANEMKNRLCVLDGGIGDFHIHDLLLKWFPRAAFINEVQKLIRSDWTALLLADVMAMHVIVLTSFNWITVQFIAIFKLYYQTHSLHRSLRRFNTLAIIHNRPALRPSRRYS